MQVGPHQGLSDAGRMRIAAALKELWPPGRVRQADVAERLTEAGLDTDQTKISAWLRGRVPTVEQLNVIEEVYGVPRGWVLTRSGFVDPVALLGTIERDELVDRLAKLKALRADLAELLEGAPKKPAPRKPRPAAPSR